MRHLEKAIQHEVHFFLAQDRKHVFRYTFALASGTNLTDYIRGVSKPF